MSNNDIPRENANEAESSNGNNPKEMERSPSLLMTNIEDIDFDSMSDEEITKYMDDLVSCIETHFSLDNEKGVNILLSTEKAGFKPGGSGKHPLKKKFPDIDFKTPEWQTWVSARVVSAVLIVAELNEMILTRCFSFAFLVEEYETL